MDHAAPHGESRQLFKGIYAGRSTGAFSGTIIVREGAQKTNAFQSSKSILVSPDAAVNTKPRLKIWADDVKCSHGATVGQLDEAALFYLRSRGVPHNTAKILLLHAFIGEVLSEIDSMEVREVIAQIVERRMKVVLEAAK
jgi:Fe-S cluster assembly protein SufD